MLYPIRRVLLFSAAGLLTAGAALIGLPANAEEGELTDTYTLEDGRNISFYQVKVQAGTSIRVSVNSEDFDTYLAVRLPDGSIVENDDATDLNSMVEIEATEDGTWIIGITSFEPGKTGAFEYFVQRIELIDEESTEHEVQDDELPIPELTPPSG